MAGIPGIDQKSRARDLSLYQHDSTRSVNIALSGAEIYVRQVHVHFTFLFDYENYI